MDWKLEVVPVPVSDVAKAKHFYADQVGFVVDHDTRVSAEQRFVQLTPRGSGCSIVLGAATTPPGSLQGLQLVVDDIEAAREELLGRGVQAGPIHHYGPEGMAEGRGGDWNSFVSFADPDGNGWVLQERPAVRDSAQESLDRLSRALDQTGALIEAARPEQATAPTPCRSWDVRTLINHVIDEVHQFALVTCGGAREASGTVGDGEWNSAYRAAAEELRAAWREPGAMERTIKLPGGEVSAAWTVGQQITELVTHAWDIAKATGQPTDLDPQLANVALQWGRDNVLPEFRGAEQDGFHLGAEVEADEDAPVYDRVAAFGGRDPGWS
ncbi:TIGR03086 family metal-binding protein [Nonomuraea sp. NPDC046570]|uniref:TIGR03086 family metal-binding protein n=1 Tax=Nonomuraea sp. NPDC046570 TaxID=3155255 RepID=UPI0033FC7AA0